MKNLDLTTTRGCILFLLDRRFACRIILKTLDAYHYEISRDRRLARKLRETNNPFNVRRAEVREECAKSLTDSAQKGRDMLLKHGRELMRYAEYIDAAVPQSLLLDLMNVNRADRRGISPDDGIADIVFVNGLEDSAMHRGGDWKQGPLAQAVSRFMTHELVHNEPLAQVAHDELFGKGGMFEFLPTYRNTGERGLVRTPPKLRLADKCDAKNEA